MINKADKGSTIVVLDKSNYIEEGLKHLDAPHVYKKLKTDITSFTKTYIMKFLNNIRFNNWLPTLLSMIYS